MSVLLNNTQISSAMITIPDIPEEFQLPLAVVVSQSLKIDTL